MPLSDVLRMYCVVLPFFVITCIMSLFKEENYVRKLVDIGRSVVLKLTHVTVIGE